VSNDEPTAPASAGDETPSSLFAGRYRIERVIGQGAFGRVYLAFDTRLRRNVAIKELLAARHTTEGFLYEQYLERFQREARAAGVVQHPNIVAVRELAIDADENHYLMMEYVDGTDLRDLLAHVGTLPVERAISITLEVARALEAVHEQDIVHRDLKPANIMLTRRGVTKVADFGVAQVGSESHRTQIGANHPGTPIYMSPEQASSTGYLDGRSDLYSLGLILYEMLVGEPYARKRQPLSGVRPDLSPQLVAIADKLMAKEADARYQHAGEVVEALESLSSTRPSVATADIPAFPLPSGGQPSGERPGSQSSGAQGAPPLGVPSAYGGAGSQHSPGSPSYPGAYPPPPSATYNAPPASDTNKGKSRALLGIGGGVLALVLVGAAALIVTHRGTPTTVTAIPPTTIAVTGPPSTPTTGATIVGGNVGTQTATVPATSTSIPPTRTTPPTQAPPTSTPTTAPTVRAVATVRPDFQTVTDQRYAFMFSYPKTWQRSEDATDQETLYSVRMSPTAKFLVAKEDNPKFGTIDAYIDDELTQETTSFPGWKVGPRARQPTTLGGQEARIADFIAPNGAGQDYHYYVFTLRPNQAWALLFVMAMSDFDTFQHDIDDVVRSFTFCPGNACPAQASRSLPSGTTGSLSPLLGSAVAILPRRRTSIRSASRRNSVGGGGL
jgi:serine/threonine protein kinase